MGIGESATSGIHRSKVSSYGVQAILEAEDREIFEHVRSIIQTALVNRVEFSEVTDPMIGIPRYSFVRDANGDVTFDIAGITSGLYKRNDTGFDRYLNGAIRSHVAATAKQWVFLHSGVVEWKGRAIIIPGHSRKGKTTLVSELIRLGAGYMSDEYAVMDESGLVHPYERDLGFRYSEEEGPVATDPIEFGGARSTLPVPAGMVLLTGFVKNGQWQPHEVSLGMGIVECVPEVIPMSFNTEFVLKVLNTTFTRAIIVKSDRGEARDFAPRILDYFDKSIISGEEVPV